MNFLTLAQRVRQECGISGTGPATVTGQTGEMKRVVDWTNQAWLEIQSSRPNWGWMSKTFVKPLNIGVSEYAGTDLALTDLRYWDKSLLTIQETQADESVLPFIDYNLFRVRYQVGTQTNNRPKEVSITPNNTLVFGPTPDKAYTISGRYFQTPSEMTANTDVPSLPSEFHMLIVYKAMEYYGVFENAAEVYEGGKAAYNRLFSRLVASELPETTIDAPPLA